jgi:hypothetical protein
MGRRLRRALTTTATMLAAAALGAVAAHRQVARKDELRRLRQPRTGSDQ